MSKDKSKLYRNRDKGMIRVNQDGIVPETEEGNYPTIFLMTVFKAGT